MRIDNIRKSVSDGKTRIEADVTFETAGRPDFNAWIESGHDLALDPNVFLLALYPVAAKYQEQRLQIGGAVSPLLTHKLRDVYAWWKAWGFIGSEGSPPLISGTALVEYEQTGGFQSAGFLSGGVDSVQMLYGNHDRFPAGHPHRITHAIQINGFSRSKKDVVEAIEPMVAQACANIVSDTGVEFITVETNLRLIDQATVFWTRQFHGPVLAAIAHAVIPGSGVARIGSSFDIAHMPAWGSHPMLDGNLGTERLSLLHEEAPLSRLDKVRELVRFPQALENVQVCTQWVPTHLNCGRCEKCMRTKLELVALGAAVPSCFADRDIKPEYVRKITSEYAIPWYEEMIAPLEQQGRGDLSQAVRQKLRRGSFARAAINMDTKLTKGFVRKAYLKAFKGI